MAYEGCAPPFPLESLLPTSAYMSLRLVEATLSTLGVGRALGDRRPSSSRTLRRHGATRGAQ